VRGLGAGKRVVRIGLVAVEEVLAVEHGLRGVDDAVEDAVDVRLERELLLQLQERLELRGVAEISHAR